MGTNETGTITLKLLAQDLASGKVGGFIGKLDSLAKKGGLAGSIMQGVGQSFGQMLNPVMLASRALDLAGDIAGKAVSALTGMAKMAREDAEETDHLALALRNSDPAFKGNLDAVNKAIEAGQDLAFTDSQIRESIGSLITRTHDETKAIGLNRLAMDLARAKKLSLATATGFVGKAFLGQVGALRRAGFAIDATATAEEALRVIQDAVTGSAELFSTTVDGKLVVSMNHLTEKMENAGAKLAFLDSLHEGMIQTNIDLTGTVLDLAMGLSGQLVAGLEEVGLKSKDTGRSIFDLGGIFTDAFNAAGVAATDNQGDISDAATETAGDTGRMVTDMVAHLQGGKATIAAAAHNLKWALTHPMAMARQQNRAAMLLMGDDMAKAINSKKWWVREQAREIARGLAKDFSGDRWFKLGRRLAREIGRGAKAGGGVRIGGNGGLY